MQSKSLLIAIAAFAVTATGVHAYGGNKILGRAGLSEKQIEAVEEAQQLRANGDYNAARDKLIEAGITESNLQAIRREASGARSLMHEALEADDYETFRKAITDTPLADIVTTPEDFEQFRQAHQLRMDGKFAAAGELFDGLGVEPRRGSGPESVYHRKPHYLGIELNDAQKQALQVARQANDRATIQAIYDEAGWEN